MMCKNMQHFNSEQHQFLQGIAKNEKENDWLQIPGYIALVEKKVNGKVVGLAGITLRYVIIPSLFVAVSPKHQGKGIASELMQQLIHKWKKPLFLTHYKHKTHLNAFYEKFGFKKIMEWSGGRILRFRL